MTVALKAREAAGSTPRTVPGLQLWLDARRPRNYDCLHLPGAAGYYASTPSSVPLSITGDIDIRVKCALTDWTPTAINRLATKYVTTGNQRSYDLYVDTTGVLKLVVSSDGASAAATLTSTVGTGLADGAVKWVRVTRAASTGATKFYLSDDGTSWSQLGTDVAGAAGAIFDSTAVLELGSFGVGASSNMAGKYYRAQIRNNILDDGTGIVFDADFADEGYTFTESSSNAATVTCNGRAPLSMTSTLTLWADLSGRNRDAVQTTSAKRPQWKGCDVGNGVITAWGDSLTAGAGGGGTTYPSVLVGLSGLTANNRGIGGESSGNIAARQNGTPTLLTVTADTIPASGAVTVTDNTQHIPTAQGSQSILGSLAGIPGALAVSGGVTTFTRTASGDATACPAQTAFITDDGVARQGDSLVIWSGRNNNSSRSQVEADIASMLAYTTHPARCLVLSILNGVGEGVGTTAYTNIVTNLNADLATTYGARYLDVRSYLVQHGLNDAGITPTAQDVTDMANDIVPTSLRYDFIHLNAAGYTVVATQVFNKLKELWAFTHGAQVYFDGTDDYMDAAFTIAVPMTWYLVGTFNDALATSEVGLSGVTGPHWLYRRSTGKYALFTSTPLESASSNTASHVFAGVFNGASSTISTDGTASTGNSGTTGTAVGGIRLAAGPSPTNYGAVSIAAVLVYSGAHDANTRKKIERWLGRQYGITVAQ